MVGRDSLNTRPWTSYFCDCSKTCPFFRPWIIRPCIGIVSSSIAWSIFGLFAFFKELMPRSDIARLIDFVKLSGVVAGSRKSMIDIISPRGRVSWCGTSHWRRVTASLLTPLQCQINVCDTTQAIIAYNKDSRLIDERHYYYAQLLTTS